MEEGRKQNPMVQPVFESAKTNKQTKNGEREGEREEHIKKIKKCSWKLEEPEKGQSHRCQHRTDFRAND